MNRKNQGKRLADKDNVSIKLHAVVENKIQTQYALQQAFEVNTSLYNEIQSKINNLKTEKANINQQKYSRKHVQFFSHQYKCISKNNNKAIIVVDEVQKILPHVDTGKMDKKARQVLKT